MYKNQKKTKEFIENFFKNRGYCVEEEYINSSTPIKIKDKNGYISKITYSNLRMGEKPTFFGINNEFLEDNVKTLIKKTNKNIVFEKYEIITKSKKKRVLVYMQCECGNHFKRVLDDINRKDRGLYCNECAKRKRGLNHRKDKNEMFNKIESLGYKILDKSKHYLRNEYIEVINQRGYRGFVKYNYLMSGKHMTIFNEHINLSNFVYNANIYAKENNINCEVLELSKLKKWNRQGLKIKCECGKLFETSVASFQNGKIRCDKCSNSMSKFEFAVKSYLEESNIKYIKEFYFNDCRDVLPLPFDFYLVDFDKIIEVDGQGHYYPVSFGGDKEQNFIITKTHDKIKNDYCREKNIPLLRLSYKDIENGEYIKIIKQFIED